MKKKLIPSLFLFSLEFTISLNSLFLIHFIMKVLIVVNLILKMLTFEHKKECTDFVKMLYFFSLIIEKS